MIANSGEKEDRNSLWESLSNRPNAEDIVRAGNALDKSIRNKKPNELIIKYEKIRKSFDAMYKRLRRKMDRNVDPNESFQNSAIDNLSFEKIIQNIETDAEKFRSLGNLLDAISGHPDYRNLLSAGWPYFY